MIGLRLLAAASAATLLLTGPTQAAPLRPRKVSFQMSDFKFSPTSAVKVKKGETITFQFANRSKVLHEAVIGTRAEQVHHDKEMAAMGAMEMPDTSNAVSVQPGKVKTLTYTFDKKGTYEIGCHQPKHYPNGMKVSIVVS
jgi:uncharacterized cupredoxin-like copper-binding protein